MQNINSRLIIHTNCRAVINYYEAYNVNTPFTVMADHFDIILQIWFLNHNIKFGITLEFMQATKNEGTRFLFKEAMVIFIHENVIKYMLLHRMQNFLWKDHFFKMMFPYLFSMTISLSFMASQFS